MDIMPKQFRGVVSGTEAWDVLSGKEDISAVVAIGIQAPLNTAFSINETENIIYIGSTGIYELNLQSGNLGTISKLIIYNAQPAANDDGVNEQETNVLNSEEGADEDNTANDRILIDILYKTQEVNKV